MILYDILFLLNLRNFQLTSFIFKCLYSPDVKPAKVSPANFSLSRRCFLQSARPCAAFTGRWKRKNWTISSPRKTGNNFSIRAILTVCRRFATEGSVCPVEKTDDLPSAARSAKRRRCLLQIKKPTTKVVGFSWCRWSDSNRHGFYSTGF